MGLDIYLQKCPDREFANQQETAYEKATDQVGDSLQAEFGFSDWDKFRELPKERQDEYWKLYNERCEPLKHKFGINDYRHKTVEKIEIDSAIYPDHMFKIGYFRSSYNDGGYNSFAKRFCVPTLGEIFDQDGDEYEFVPDWGRARGKALVALEKLRTNNFGYDVMAVDVNPFVGVKITDEKLALSAFNAELERWNKIENSFDSYQTQAGWFIKKGTTVYAVLPGLRQSFGPPVPCAYIITKNDDNWYKKALEIVIETCDYVLAQPDIKNFYLTWSG